MSNTIQKIVHEKDIVTVTVQWNGRPFVVEIGSEGVVVAAPNKKGNIDRGSNPSVWVDPHDIVTAEGDPKKEPLLVHSYFDNEHEGPVTVELTKGKAVLGGDGFQFVKFKDYCRNMLVKFLREK